MYQIFSQWLSPLHRASNFSGDALTDAIFVVEAWINATRVVRDIQLLNLSEGEGVHIRKHLWVDMFANTLVPGVGVS